MSTKKDNFTSKDKKFMKLALDLARARKGLTGENPIDLTVDFTNISPYTQEIWARIVNVDITTFTCLGYAKVAELYVEPRPIA